MGVDGRRVALKLMGVKERRLALELMGVDVIRRVV
jgi:hypothetical protein